MDLRVIITSLVITAMVLASATAGYWFANSRQENSAGSETASVVLATPRPLPTYTPYPTYTLVPTYTPFPTQTVAATPTFTPYPTSTPASTPTQPTYTPRPKPTATAVLAFRLSNLHNNENTRWLDHQLPELAEAIATLPWVEDGLTDAERTLINEISHVAVADAQVAREMISQPFLQQSYQTHDLHLVNAITSLLYEERVDDLRHTEIWQRRSVTDSWAPAAAAVAAVASPNAYRNYLDERKFTIGNHEVPTALNHDLRVSIIRKEGDAARSETAAIVQEAIDSIEKVMGAPLPTDHVIIIFDEQAVITGYAGTHHGFAIASAPQTEDESRERLFSHIAHEAAHYWWSGNEDWLDEGLADTIAASASAANGYEVAAQPNRRRNCAARNLSEIGDAGENAEQFHCNYYLGEKLFRALQDTVPANEFREALQEIYSTSRRKHEELQLYRAGIIEVRRAFGDHSTIVNRYWNGDVNTPETQGPDDQLNFTSHLVVRWTQKPAYLNGVVSFSGTLAGDATLATRTVAEAQEFSGYANFTVNDANGDFLGSILPPLTGGSYWHLEDPADAVAATYEIYEKTFTIAFQWPDSAGDFRDKHVTIWGYNNTERVPEINDGADPLGQSMIR